MKVFSLKEAEASRDIDIKMMATRASRYRVFGSSERIPVAEMVVIDLRDGVESPDFERDFNILERHQVRSICLARKIAS